jgi:hypothetical membrane protein
LGGACAVAAVVVGLGGVFAGVAISPWFTWTGNALSDLGDHSRSSAALFNGGLILAGALYLEFVWALWGEGMPARPRIRVGLVMLALGSAFLMGVGIVPVGVDAHFPISVGYFFSYPPGVIVLGMAARDLHPRMRVLSLACAGCALLFGILQFTPVFPDQAIPELILSSALSLWSAVVGYWMFSGRLAAKAVTQ